MCNLYHMAPRDHVEVYFRALVPDSYQHVAVGPFGAGAASSMLDPIGKPIRWVTGRVFGIGHTAIDTVYGGFRDEQRDETTYGRQHRLPAEGNFNPDVTLSRPGLFTLGHEVGHVSQRQNGVGDTIHGALGAQAEAGIVDGDWTGAYDWRAALGEGKTFKATNQEQRARVMEEIGIVAEKVEHGRGAG